MLADMLETDEILVYLGVGLVLLDATEGYKEIEI